MLFSDTYDAGAGIDPGGGGFLSAIGVTPDAPSEPDLEPESQDEATAADALSPEDDLSGEELVAARFAAVAEEEGVDVEGGTEAPDEGGAEDQPDLEQLSPEELKALAQEALTLKAQESTSQGERLKELVRQKVQDAESAAIAAVTRQFEETVLARSAEHYDAELAERIATIVRLSRNQDNPDQFIIQQSMLATRTVMAYRQQWEAEQAANWDQRAFEAAAQARMNVPELRALYARDLAEQYNLPETAIADIAHGSRHIENFDQRAQELAALAKTLGNERKKTAQQKRQQANARLREQPIRTSASARPAGGKPPAYKGTPDEFVAWAQRYRE